MSTTIDSLDIQIATNADKAAKKIEKLANALGKLKDNANLTKVNDSLNKLKTTLEGLDTGFGKLPRNINATVTATNRMSKASKDMGDALDTSSVNLMANISNFQALAGVMNHAIQIASNFLAQAIEWDGIQFRFGRAFGEDAEEVYQYVLKINEVLGINTQEFMQYSSLYGSLLSGFGMAQKKVTAISVGLTELSYDIWAAYNDRFKTLEDASEAVRSAITGEIEPIRNAGIALTEASLQEYIDSTHLAGVSIEKLTEAQKAEVRYAAMVNAAMNQGIVGTYAREMNTAEGAVRSLSQSFKTLIQALGSLFIPLLQLVVPYVTAFVELLTDAVFWVAELFNIPIQRINWADTSKGVGGLADGAKDASSGLGKAAKAAKKLKDYTMGFDELNVISPDTGSSGGAGAGAGDSGWGEGLDLKKLWDDSVFAQASKRVDELKEKIKSLYDEWKWAFVGISAVLATLAVVKHWGTIVGWFTKISGVFTVIKVAIGTLISTIPALWKAFKGGSAATSALTFMYPKLTGVVTTISNFVTKYLGPISKFLHLPIWGTFAVVLAAIASTVYFLYENWGEVTSAVKKFFKENISPKLQEIKKHFDKLVDALGPVRDLFTFLKDKVMPGVGKAFEVVGGIIFSVVGGVISTAFNVLLGLVENSIQYFSGAVQIVSGVIDLIVAVFTKGDIGAAWEKIWDGAITLLKGLVGGIVQPVIDAVSGILGWFGNLYTELTGKKLPNIINGVKTWFAKLPSEIDKKLDEAWEKVKDFFSISKWKQKVTDAIGAIKDNFKMPSLPRIKLDVAWDTNVGKVKKAVYQALGLDGWPNLNWSTYATGGFPTTGEMFIAREAGPELVGKIGNRSTVANNDQIVTAVSQGVYSAVRAAMGGENGNSQNINVYLDGKQIYASVKRTEAQRGVNLMGNQLGYNY